MSRMTTRSMTTRSMTRAMQDAKIHAAKIQSIIAEMEKMNRPTTRSMCDLTHKRFHEDPYPVNKRPRIEQDPERDGGECLLWMMLAMTVVNVCVILYYCYYHLEFVVKV